jgi:CLIP-associating protein 1/2
LSDATVVTIVQDKAECKPDIGEISQQAQAPEDPSKSTSMSPTVNMNGSGKLQKQSPDRVNSNKTIPGPQQAGKHRSSTPKKSIASKGPRDSYTPNFRRPLLSKQMANWFYASTRSDLDEKKLIWGEMVGNMDVPSSLTEALSLGVDPRSDWMMRVYAFNFLRRCLLEHGPKGIQEVAQNFEKVMRFVCRYLDDPHHKVALASLSSLAEIMPAFKKPFEHYLDKTLPHIFSRINDPKEPIKQQCLAIVKLSSEIYSIDSLLPALLRSLDEHKSPKLKLSIIEFANASFVRCTVNTECYFSSSFLKPWLGKLALLSRDKNSKLKEVAVAGFSSIYSHYDPASVLSFLVSMSMEEQKRLRWALKQSIPTIESDLEEFLQERRHRQKAPSFDPFTAKSPLHPAYQSAKSPLHPAYQSAKSPLHPAYQSAKSPLHPAYQSAKSPLHPAYHSAKSPLHPAYKSNAVGVDDLFGSALQCLPNISLELQEYSPGKIESESSNESCSRKAGVLDNNSGTKRSRNDLARGSGRSVVSSENTDRSLRRDLMNSKRPDDPNLSEVSVNFRNHEVVRNNCQDHEVRVSQIHHQISTVRLMFCLIIVI